MTPFVSARSGRSPQGVAEMLSFSTLRLNHPGRLRKCRTELLREAIRISSVPFFLRVTSKQFCMSPAHSKMMEHMEWVDDSISLVKA
ncbi:hypothetical protein ABZ829_15695 [Streptomyces xanthochromogenes]|uniref:hypothetical protein n=1 Tax=Streptomyces xanthochromogenes TaxID=67384 RepID=UPI0034432BBD